MRHTRFGWPWLLAALVIGGGAGPITNVPTQIEIALQSREYDAAIRAIDEQLGRSPDDADYLTYLKGRAYFLSGKYAEAADIFRALEANFPQSDYVRRSRFGTALALMRKGDFHEAEEIYRKEAEYLISADRKQEIASIYLEFAEAFFAPQEQDAKPDFNQAIEFFSKALEVGPKPETRADVELKLARCYQELSQLDEAANRYMQFSQVYPDSALDIEARYRLGECRLLQGNPIESRRTWEDLIAKYQDSDSPRVAETMFRLAETHGLPQPPSDEDLEQGVSDVRDFLKRFPDHESAGKAHLTVAQSYVARGRFEEAVKSLLGFIGDARYAAREEIADARFLLGRCFQLQKKFDQAIQAWQEYLTKHPAHSSWSQAQQQIIQTEFLSAQEDLASKKYDEARTKWTNFLERYPLDSRAPGILLTFGRMNQDQQKWPEAIADWRRLVSKYPGTEESSQGQYLIAAVLEQQLHDYEGALKEYGALDWGSMQPAARQSIERLTSKGLTIATERIHRSDEQPVIKLTTRNIETVTVKVYRVDMEAYFRKMHAGQGVERLDIALIDPDASFEYRVPEYAPYRLFEGNVEIPVPGGDADRRTRVLAVSVNSETLESTTMVVQSDLDIIVKSSRDEVFVFAENLRTGEPWPSARLLISDGQAIFAEVETGDDGVYRGTFGELQRAGDVRVLALDGENVASTNLSLAGLGVAQGLTEKGYIYTERPAYRAGQLVHVRGIIRLVENDQYTIPKNAKYQLDVYDSRGRLLVQEDVALNEHGSLQRHFPLPVGAPAGVYRVVVHNIDGKTFQGEFKVHEYRLEPVVLTVDTDRHVFYRGEEIEGTITAKYRHGSPLPNREVRYQLADGRIYTALTDAQGKARFKLATREFRESQTLPLAVSLPEQNISAGVNFFLATQGMYLTVESVRDLYVTGESWEATVTAKDPEGKPVEGNLSLHVLKRTEVNGQYGEVSVSRHEVITNKETGTARVTLALQEAGTYILRAEGADRFENPISGSRIITVSGDEDDIRLRLLADKYTLRAGEQGRVNIHWREAPALALVTFQGAKVLDYRLVKLNRGDNPLEFAATATLAPNFDLHVVVMADRPERAAKAARAVRRFHESSSPFTVEQDLRVQVDVRRHDGGAGTPSPGEEVDLVVTTTDALGTPVSAEVSLAMIEKALWEMFPDAVAPIGAFFRGTPRESAVRTASSVTFEYHPQTTAISETLLAEEHRSEVAAEEAARLTELATSADFDSLFELMATTNAAVDGNALGELVRAPAAAASELPVEVRDVPAGVGGYGGGLGQAPQRGRRGGLMRGADAKLSARELEQIQSAGRRFDKSLGLGIQAQSWSDGMQRQLADESQSWARQFDTDLAAGYSFTVPLVDREGRHLSQGIHWDRDNHARGADQVLMYANGAQANFNARYLSRLGRAEAEVYNKRLAEAGAMLMINTPVVETAYWNPVVVTDNEGRATLTTLLPERSTAWKLVAKGITDDALAGQSESDLIARKELFGELRVPAAAVDGDHVDVLATIHHDKVASVELRVTLETKIGDRSSQESRTLKVDGQGTAETSFGVDLRLPTPAEGGVGPEAETTFTLTVTDGNRTDVTSETIPLLPYGEPVYATSAGAAESDITTWVEPPSGMAIARPSLMITIGPDMERSLLDVLFAPSPWLRVTNLQHTPALDRATSDLMAAIALREMLSASRDVAAPEIHTLESRIRASLGLLVSSQLDDGGWSWSGRAGESNVFTSARAAWALGLSRKAGMKIPPDAMAKASQYLRNTLTATDNADFEIQAVLLQALAALGEGDYTLTNRLHRVRDSLGPAALAYLALALADMDRAAMAADVLSLLNERNGIAGPASNAAAARRPWLSAPVEVLALHALALQRVAPDSAKAKEVIDRLLAARAGNRWEPDKATGPAMLALGHWQAKNRFQPGRYQLAILVNDKEVKTLDLAPGALTQTLDVPAEYLANGKQRIQFRLTGRGRYSYQCLFAGMVPADQLQATSRDHFVERIYEPAPLEVDGEAIPQGFDILQGNYVFFRNPLTQLPRGQTGRVQLIVHRHYTGDPRQDGQTKYMIVSEPLPAGVTVVDGSVQGNFEYYEIQPGRIVFYVTFPYDASLSFQVRGYLPGSYRAGPTVARSAYDLGQFAVAPPSTLSVLESKEKSADEYRLTPRELYELGKRSFARGEWAQAGEHLAKLIQDWNLNPEVYRDTARMLLDVHLETGPAREVVRYFEIIKQKWPDLEITFDKILKVGAAYDEMGEYERSYLVFRATVEASFEQESGVAGFLDGRGEFLRSVDVMNRLIREYPPEPYVAAAQFSLSQRVYSKAPEAASDEKLRSKKVNRVTLIQQAATMLGRFLAENPDDPAADQASFSLANALLDLKLYKQVIARCTRFGELYPQSAFLDSFWYLIGYCHFALGEHDQAIEMCRKVVETKRTDPQTGRESESANKWRAIYIMGQVYHSLDQAVDAIREYALVADRFPDAKAAMEYFTRKAITLPEVTTVKSGEPVELKLTFRNVPSVDLRVYRIDLLKFGLLKRNLAGITDINLSGIRPVHEAEVALGDGRDYRDRDKSLTLPLTEEGAYLVVCRGENQHASGFVVVTPLAMEVREDSTAGQVRVTIKDQTAGRFASGVHVKVIGSQDQKFVSGETDLRGVFVAEGVHGTATILARGDDDRYSFHRGSQLLGQVPEPEARPRDAAAMPDQSAGEARKDVLLEDLGLSNSTMQQQNNERLKQLYDRNNRGVQAEKAY